MSFDGYLRSQGAELLAKLWRYDSTAWLLNVGVAIAYCQTYVPATHRLVKMPVDREFTFIQVVATVKMLPQANTQVEVLSRAWLVVGNVARICHSCGSGDSGFGVGDCDLLSAVIWNCVSGRRDCYNVVAIRVVLAARSSVAVLIEVGCFARMTESFLWVDIKWGRWIAYVGREPSSGIAMTELNVASAKAKVANLNILMLGIDWYFQLTWVFRLW